MIFRWLYKRKMTRLFGRYISEQKNEELTDGHSEWESFKSLLPRAIHRLFFKPVMSEVEGLRKLQETLRDAIRDAPDLTGDKHGDANPPTKID